MFQHWVTYYSMYSNYANEHQTDVGFPFRRIFARFAKLKNDAHSCTSNGYSLFVNSPNASKTIGVAAFM